MSRNHEVTWADLNGTELDSTIASGPGLAEGRKRLLHVLTFRSDSVSEFYRVSLRDKDSAWKTHDYATFSDALRVYNNGHFRAEG